MLLAENDTVGAGAATATLTDRLALPPMPLQVRVNVLSDVSDETVCDPLMDLLPDQLPEAVHVLALLLDQFSVVEPLWATLVLLADSDTMGAGGAATVTDTD